MRVFWLSLACGAVLACQISPVVSSPEERRSRYWDCDRAAREYCEHSIGASDPEMDACVAEYRYRCVSAGARSRSSPRS